VDYALEGSNNGTTFTVVSSGTLSLPDARVDNLQAFDPTVQPMQEILFANNVAYTVYRLTHNNVKDNSHPAPNDLQLGEIELLGVAAPNQPPVLSVAIVDGSLVINTTVDGTLQSTTNLTGTIIWVDEGPISGSTQIVPSPGVPQKYYRVLQAP
jgi:hypothetical protein